MIGLTRGTVPATLTPTFVATETARFMLDGSSVWNVADIKAALFNMSGGKCAYCELLLGEGATYLEVEHFYAKHHHPSRVLEWSNLLPACRRCNGKKGKWDVDVAGQMMVDPVSMTPKLHMRLDEAYRPIGLTPEGQNTILEIDLDDIPRLGVMRFKLGETLKRKIDELYHRYTGLPLTATNRQRRSVIRSIKKALESCHSDQPFSAVMATVLARSPEYAALKASMIAAGEWDALLVADDMTIIASSLA
jgi:hypothetical protein